MRDITAILFSKVGRCESRTIFTENKFERMKLRGEQQKKINEVRLDVSARRFGVNGHTVFHCKSVSN